MTVVIWCSGVVLCVDRCKFASCCCEPHCNGCMMLHGLCFGEEAGARNLVFFRVKWLRPAMKGTSSVRRVRLGSVYRFFLPQCNGGFKLLWVCLCVRSYRVFWNLCLQIALEWLHDVAIVFSRFVVEIRFWAAISDAIARSSIVFRNSVSADRIGVAASRLLGAAAACVILLSFAAEDCKWYGVAASRLRKWIVSRFSQFWR